MNLDEDVPFFEPLLRSLVLALGAGFLCELMHVLGVVRGVRCPSRRLLQASVSCLPAPLPACLPTCLTPAFLPTHTHTYVYARACPRVHTHTPPWHRLGALHSTAAPASPRSLPSCTRQARACARCGAWTTRVCVAASMGVFCRPWALLAAGAGSSRRHALLKFWGLCTSSIQFRKA